ncbi:MAG: DUF2442 domain-containing protein [Gemmatimonadota bacterium]
MAKPSATDRSEFARQNQRARREAREADRVEPRALAVSYDADSGLVLVRLRGGYVFGFPPHVVPGLENADRSDLSSARISPSGDGLHWDDLDVQASLTGLMVEALDLQRWGPRIMGQARSEAKASVPPLKFLAHVRSSG